VANISEKTYAKHAAVTTAAKLAIETQEARFIYANQAEGYVNTAPCRARARLWD
jgi:hypothetical protein